MSYRAIIICQAIKSKLYFAAHLQYTAEVMSVFPISLSNVFISLCMFVCLCVCGGGVQESKPLTILPPCSFFICNFSTFQDIAVGVPILIVYYHPSCGHVGLNNIYSESK